MSLTFPKNLDAFFIEHLTQIRYLTGFTGSFARLLVFPKKQVLLTDDRYIAYAKTLQGIEITNIKDENWKKLIEGKILGFDPRHTSIERLKTLKKQFTKTQWKAKASNIDDLRRTKNKEEQDTIRQACHLGSTIVERVWQTLRVGVSEQEVAIALQKEALNVGITELSFNPIVAFEKNAAIPHHSPGDAKLKAGDTVLVDFGVKYNGYCSDMTRTVFFKKASSEKQNMYALVKKAHDAGMQKMRAGNTIASAFEEANAVFIKEGKEQYFTHSLGHGVGLEIHEFPGVHTKIKGNFLEGEIITCEPGLYFPEQFGIRIENMGAVRKNTFEVFTLLNDSCIIL